MKYQEIKIRLPRPEWNLKFKNFLPTPGNVIFTLLVLGMLYFAQSVGALPAFAPAAVGTSTGTIAYQGRLADTGGTPLTNTYNMIFRLYNTATGGTPLWEEQWTGSNSVKVSDGLFNVMLGSLTPIPQNIITGNDTLYLGITVGTDNEMSPRVQLGSVPFAVQALTVPDGSITGAKIATGAITTTNIADGAVTGNQLNRKLTRITPTNTIAMTNASQWYDGLSATIVLDKETLVTIQASEGLQYNSGDTLLAARVVIDGNPLITSHQYQKSGIGEQHMLVTSLLLGAGQHTIKLQGFSWAPNSYIVGDNRTQLTIIEG